MRERIRSFIMLIVVLVSGSAAVCQQTITLENSELKVTLSAENATVMSVTKKQTNTSYLGSSEQSGWFKVQIPLPNWDGHAASSRNLKSVTVKKRGMDSVEIRTNLLRAEDGQYAVPIELVLRLEGENLVCRLKLQNNTKQTIDRVTFPILDVPPAAARTEAIFMPNLMWPLGMVFSKNQIQTAHNPFLSLDPVDVRAWFYSDPRMSVKAIDYPADLPTGWVSYTADGKGIGFDVRDKSFQFKRFFFERRLYRDTRSREANRYDFELSWQWYPLVKPGESWDSSDVYIHFGTADWHGIAAQHRDWLKTWIGRPQVAPLLKASLGWISRNIRSYDEIPTHAKQGVEVGAPYFIMYGWSPIGSHGMSYDAYPRKEFGGLESLRRNLDAARALGSYPMAWTNETVSVETNLGHQLMGKDWTVMDRWGSAVLCGRWSFFEPMQIAIDHNNDVWMQMDPSTGDQEFLLETARRLIHDYHFAGYEFDQGHKNFLSYRPEHAQPALAVSQGYSKYFAAAQEIVKKADPNGIIVGENLSEMMNQFVDSTWIFEGGALNVPQLSMTRYSLPWVTVPTRASVTDRGHANQAFMTNSPLDIFEDLTKHPEYAQHLRQLHALKKAAVQYFYQGDFSDAEGFTLEPAVQKGVLAKSYRDPKFTAVTVVNTGANSLKVRLRPDQDLVSRNVRHYFLDGRTESPKSSGEMELSLAAYDVQIVAFESQ